MLRKLHCIYTDVSKLDLSNNRELRELYVYGTDISELDLSNNKLLEYIDVPSEVEIIR